MVPILIGGVSLAGRRWGPAISGWLVGLPLSSAPITLFLALEQGTAFAARAAQGTLMGLISASAFCVVYGWLAHRLGWAAGMLGGWAAFLAATAVLDQISVSLAVSFVAVIGTIAASLKLLPNHGRGAVSSGAPGRAPGWEIPLRMIAATTMVLTITAVAAALGPRLSGLLTPFPVYTSVLAGFTHHFQGPAATVGLLRGVQTGLFTFAVFFLVVAGSVQTWSLLGAFGLASLIAVLMHAGSFRSLGRQGDDAGGPGEG